MKKLGNTSDDCLILMQLMPLHCTLKNVKMQIIHYISYIIYIIYTYIIYAYITAI